MLGLGRCGGPGSIEFVLRSGRTVAALAWANAGRKTNAEFVVTAVNGRAPRRYLAGSGPVRSQGDRAWSTCSPHATQVPVDPGQAVVTTIDADDDELRRTAGGCKIGQRELRAGYNKKEKGSA